MRYIYTHTHTHTLQTFRFINCNISNKAGKKSSSFVCGIFNVLYSHYKVSCSKNQETYTQRNETTRDSRGFQKAMSIMKRSSRPEVFCKKGVLKTSQISQGNTCARVYATLLKKRLWYRCFPANFAKLSRILIFKEHLVSASE